MLFVREHKSMFKFDLAYSCDNDTDEGELHKRDSSGSCFLIIFA